MTIIEQSVEIMAPIKRVYQVSQDYSVRYEWDPFPENISVLNDSFKTLKVGTQVWVRSKLGMEMLVEFVQVAPPQRTAIKMISGPWLLEKFAGSWIFEPQGNNTTLARFRYSFSTRPAAIRKLTSWVAAMYFKRMTRKRLIGLKKYCEKLV